MRADKPFPKGEIVLNVRKLGRDDPPEAERIGEINPGMMGVTVLFPDGSSRLYPWQVVAWVEFDPC